ncbi:CheR family methyltransferase [Streptomyces sp. NPDC054855]
MSEPSGPVDGAAKSAGKDQAPEPTTERVPAQKSGRSGDAVGEGLENLLGFIRDARGFDFTGYKRAALGRRIRERMGVVGARDYADYRDLLETDTAEFRALFDTILINVTSVFRDPGAWDLVRREVLPQLLADSGPEREIRVWSAGCSSGEEAYSLAIMFAEALGVEESLSRVKIHATDVDEGALRGARAGRYPAKNLETLSTELRDKYFERHGTHYVVRPDLRRQVVFGRHDITRDAPVSRLDLLVCRNTLMYFDIETQTQIVDRFHLALREGGYLFLGRAEMLLSDSGSERFEAVDVRRRVFRRRPGTAVSRHLRDLLLDASQGASVALDLDGLVVMINHGARARFGLSVHDVGRPFQDLELSCRPTELRSLIDRSTCERRPLRVNAAERRAGNETQYFDIVVQPVSGSHGSPVATVVMFTDVTVATRLKAEAERVRAGLETAYAELRSTNEELETTNEELQSTNEELQTTNEELQSGNEELETMNDELRLRSTDLDETRALLEGVVSSIAAGVVVLSADMRTRSWNRGAIELWGLRADEVLGKNFLSLDFGLPTEKLRELIPECVASGERSGPVVIPAVNRIGRRIDCSVICSPFDARSGGVVLLMEDIKAGGGN